MTELEELRWKASKYDDVVAALHVADGGRYRTDTVESVIRAAESRRKALVYDRLLCPLYQLLDDGQFDSLPPIQEIRRILGVQ